MKKNFKISLIHSLGQARLHSFLAWDDDIDLIVKKSDLKSLLRLFRKKAIQLSSDWVAVATLSSVIPLKIIHKKFGVYIDVFELIEYGDKFAIKNPGLLLIIELRS